MVKALLITALVSLGSVAHASEPMEVRADSMQALLASSPTSPILMKIEAKVEVGEECGYQVLDKLTVLGTPAEFDATSESCAQSLSRAYPSKPAVVLDGRSGMSPLLAIYGSSQAQLSPAEAEKRWIGDGFYYAHSFVSWGLEIAGGDQIAYAYVDTRGECHMLSTERR